MVRQYLRSVSGVLPGEFEEVKSGRDKGRPQFIEALRFCRLRRATLVVARLDRLARDLVQISNLLDGDVEFVAADFPLADRLSVQILAAVAEYERQIISDRIKEAIAAAKARGAKRGGIRPATPEQARSALAKGRAVRQACVSARARDLAPTIWPLVAQGMSPAGIALELNRRGVPAARGGVWHPSSASLVLARMKTVAPIPVDAQEAVTDGCARYRARLRARELAPLVRSLRETGLSLQRIADELNRRRIETPKNSIWRTSTVWMVLDRTRSQFSGPGGGVEFRAEP